MTRVALTRAVDGFELESPKVETYIYTISAVLQSTRDPGLAELGEELTTAFKEFKRKVENTLEEVNQYLDVIYAERRL